MRDAEIRHLKELIGQPVRIHGWLYNSRSSGKLRFLVVRDGSGYLQAVVFEPAKGEKCERCWRVLPDVGTHKHPGTCQRCNDALG